MMSASLFIHNTHRKRAEEMRQKNKAKESRREKETRAIGTEYVLRSRKGEDREDEHPGRRQSQVRCVQLRFPHVFP